MIKETLEDIEFKYIFIKEFKWYDTIKSEHYAGHPKQEHVYRSVWNKSTKNYKILIPGTSNSLLFDRLIVDAEHADCNCQMVELSKANIIDANLTESHLDEVINWIDNDNKDVKKWFQPLPPQAMLPVPMQALRNAMNAQEEEEVNALQHANKILGNIFVTNSQLFYLILEVADELHQNDIMSANDMTLSIVLGEGGKGVNVREAMLNLEQYMERERNGGDNRNNVISSIISLFTELERRDLNDLDYE